MNTAKYFSVLLAGVMVAGALSSCSENTDVKHGKGDAVIGFASDTYTFKESAGIVKIPVEIKGSPKDYPLTFDVKCEKVTSDKEVSEIMVFTQMTGFKDNGAVLADSTKVPINIEFKIIDDKDINEDRTYKLSIENVKGATLSETAVANVVIRDNDNNPYEKLWGDWTCTCTNISSSSSASWPVNISGGFTSEEEEANADKMLVAWGFGGQKEDVSSYKGYDPLKQPAWYISIDIDAGTLFIQTNTRMADIWSFNGIDEDCIVKVATAAPGETSPGTTYQVKGTFSKDFNTITFEKGASVFAMVYGVSGTLYGRWMGFSDLVLTR